ncbi:cupin domain-containing protein [Marimonas sp. MJW-29]|uniref:Cupin domain-containing protein n=1 Tax=Sulfitobacter sediminis TaxID=3234186 RepID=A0ABV3RNC2_9RHOB
MAYKLLRRSDWASAEGWNGKFEGRAVDTGVSFLFNEVREAGKGPPLHKHPYDEVYIVRKGQGHVIIGDDEMEVSEGDILIIPANTPHNVLTAGRQTTEIISVHVSDTFKGEFLEGSIPENI